MLLEPGPLPQLSTSWYPTTYEAPDFEAMVSDWWMQAADLVVQMDSWIDPRAAIDQALTGDTIYTDLTNVDRDNGNNASSINLSGIANGDGMKANGDKALLVAIQSTPAEAFMPVPATTLYATVQQPGPTARIAGVTLGNISGPNAQYYQVGDQYRLQVHMDMNTGQAADSFNVHIYLVLTKDGIAQPHFDMGHTDATGYVTYIGQWAASDQGQWTMFVHADPSTGGDVESIEYQWTVAQAGRQTAGPTTPAVSVQLQNTTTFSLSNNTVTDQWQLTVSGPPDAPVYVWATHDGAALAEIQLGTTDAAGHFTLNGSWGPADAGDWTEHYAVGHFVWPGSLVFTIQPLQKPAGGTGA